MSEGVAEEQDAVSVLVEREHVLWALAIAFFGVGDLVTTTVGLQFEQLIEVGPLTAPVIEQYGLAAMVSLKSLAFACCSVLWWYTPRPYNVGVSLGLAVFGIIVTLWNLALLALLTLH